MSALPALGAEALSALSVLTAVTASFTQLLLGYVSRSRRVWEGFTLSAMGLTALMTWALMGAAYSSGKPLLYRFGGWPPPVGIVYEVDRFSALLGALVSSVMLLIGIYSTRYMEGEHGLRWYYTLLLGVEAGMLGCLYTGDFFNLFVMFEVTGVAAYALVAYRRYDRVAIEASMKYAIFGALATTMYFAAVALAYGGLGTLNMADMALKLSGRSVPVSSAPYSSLGYTMALFTVLALWAFTFKAAIFPNHFWLPDAHSAAPTPVSALLSGLVVKVGVYAIARFTYTIYSTFEAVSAVKGAVLTASLVLGAVSALLASASMLVQRDVKKLIAYSTVVNIGYISMGLGLGSPLGLVAATYHIVNHAISKALLFLATGVLIKAVGTREIDGLRGVGRALPITSITLGIATMSLAGLPPFNVFVSKFLLYSAFIESGLPALTLAVLVPSVIAFVAYAKVLYTLCVKPCPEGVRGRVREDPVTLVPLLALAVTCVALGVLGAPYVLSNYVNPAVSSLTDTEGYIDSFLELARALPGT